MSKSGKHVLIFACIIVLLGLGYIFYSNATMVTYREGNYSDYKCSYDLGWNRCSKEAVCKVKLFSSKYYYCAEHADFGKEMVDSAKTNIKNTDNHNSGYDGEGVCKSCGRQFEAGDSAGNYKNIAKTGMCNNCYNNFKSFTD